MTNLPLNTDSMGRMVDESAERSVVGCILIGRPVSHVMAIASAIITEVDMFTDGACRAVYAHLLELHREGNAFDPDVTLLEGQLRDKGVLDEVGGTAGMIDLASSVSTVAHLEHYAKRVRDVYYRRGVMRSLAGAHSQLAGVVAEDGFFAEAERWLTKLTEITHHRSTETTSHISALLPDPERTERSIARTGITWIDQKVGLAFGEYVIVAGRPSMGKSSLANQISTEAAKNGAKVAIFSQEMDPESWLINSIAREADVDGSVIRAGTMDDQQMDRFMFARATLQSLPIHFMRKSSRNIASVLSEATRLNKAHGVQLIVVDYIQNVPSGQRDKSENESLTYISRCLQALARDLGICVIAVSQLSRGTDGDRGVKTPAPGLNRLRGSGSIEQDADVALFVHRPEYYAKGKATNGYEGKAQVLCEKNRNGPTGVCWFSWQPQYFRFRELQHDAWPGQSGKEDSSSGPSSSGSEWK